MSSAVAHALPPSILALFAPRQPVDFKPPIEKRKMLNYTTMAQFVQHFEDPKETPPPGPGVESKEDRRARKQTLKAERRKAELDAEIEKYDPTNDETIGAGDPYKTLFVARMNYETTEETLRKSFEQFGTIKSCKLVRDMQTKQPKGYAFVEFEHERDMKTAYKQGDGKKIDGRRVLVDVERGRTVRNWRPRRLGGGLGSTRAGGRGAAIKNSGRDVGFGGGGVGPVANANTGASQVGSASSTTPSGMSQRPGGAPSFTWSTETRTERSSGGGSGGYRPRDGDRPGGDRGDRERDRERRGVDDDRRRREDDDRRRREEREQGRERGDRERGDRERVDRGDRERDRRDRVR